MAGQKRQFPIIKIPSYWRFCKWFVSGRSVFFREEERCFEGKRPQKTSGNKALSLCDMIFFVKNHKKQWSILCSRREGLTAEVLPVYTAGSFRLFQA